MTEQHLTIEQLTGYRQGALAALDLLATDDHLTACASCREQLQPNSELSGLSASVREAFLPAEDVPPGHLDYAQIEALVEGTLGAVEREIVSGHLSVCASCTEEVRALSAFRAELAATTAEATPATDQVREAAPERPAVINVEAPAQVGYGKTRQRGWWSRLKSRLNPHDWSFAEAGALAALAVAAVLGLAWYAQRADRDRKLAQNAPPPPIVGGPAIQPPIAPVTLETPSPGVTIPLPVDPNATAPPPPPVDAPPINSGGNIFGPSLPSAPPPSTMASLPGAPAYPQTAPPLPPLPATEYVAQLQDGASGIALDKQGHLTGAEGLAPDTRQAVKTALEKQQVEVAPLPTELRGPTGTLMGNSRPHEGVPFALSGPVGKVIRTDKPGFSWQKVPNATGYVVTVYDQNFTEVANSGKITGTTWQPKKGFMRGVTYSWQVKATTASNEEIISPRAPAPAASFKVLEAQYNSILDQARQAYGKSHLVLGIFYARTGLLDEAEQEFKALANANPNSPVARNLLKELQKARK